MAVRRTIDFNRFTHRAARGFYESHPLRGTAAVSQIFERTMKLCVVTIEVEAVENVMIYGGKVTIEPEYEKTYNPELAKKLHSEVYELFRQND
jgi:hypothetical protein